MVARESKATKRPAGSIAGALLLPLASSPREPTETRIVAGEQGDPAPMQVSRTKISLQPFESPGTRLVASEAKATKRPSEVTEGERLAPLASEPSNPTEMRIAWGKQLDGALWQVSWRKIWLVPASADADTRATNLGAVRDPLDFNARADAVCAEVPKQPVFGQTTNGQKLEMLLPAPFPWVGPGPRTPTENVSGAATSLLGTVAVRWLASTKFVAKLVALGLPLVDQVTFDPETNPEPSTDKVKSGLPAFTEDGDIREIDELTVGVAPRLGL